MCRIKLRAIIINRIFSRVNREWIASESFHTDCERRRRRKLRTGIGYRRRNFEKLIVYIFITYIICKMLHIEFYGFIFDFYRSTLQNYSPATHRTGESNLFLVHFILILLILCIYNSYFKDGSALANQICDVQSGKMFVQCARISQVHCVLVKFSHDQLCWETRRWESQ